MLPRLAATVWLVLLPCAMHAQGPPDLVLTGGKVFTADPARPWAEAVAVRGQRIVAVGSTAEVGRLAGRRTRRIALGGRVVVPGFNDAHDHIGGAEYGVPFATGASPMPDPNAATVLDSVRALAGRTPAGTWLHTRVGLRILEDTAARRDALDRAAPNHPLILWAWTGHGAIVNTAAMRALGIPEDARDPLGGWHDRDAAGRLNGALHEYAEWSPLRRLYSGVADSVVIASLRAYADGAVRLGVTSAQSMNGYLDPAKTVRVLRAARLPIRLRVIPYLLTDTAGRRLAEWRDVERRPAPLTVISGAKWVLDSTPIERNALMRRPYLDRPGWHGRPDFPPDTVRAMLREALAGREQLMLHIAGDSTLRVVFTAMQSLAPDSVWRPLRVRIEHGDWLGGDLLPVARRLGVVLVQNPTHFALDPAMLSERFGRVPTEFQPIRSTLAAGVPLAIGSDGPGNPFLNLMFAVTHPTRPDEALTREQAVTAYTRGSAYAEFAEREKGTLAPGMLADLAVLSQDIFTIPVQALPATTSVLTLVGGAIVHDALTPRGSRDPPSRPEVNRSLDPAELEAAAARLRPANLAFAARYTGETALRQPVHTVYQGAQHFRHDAAAEHGRVALRALREYAPTAHDFAHALGIPADEALYARVVEKLEREPVEDFRADFEDGYGYPPDDEEDAAALAVADEMARGMEAGTLPAYVGLRLKALNEELRTRSIRTLDLFLTRLLERTGGRLPEGFILTVPKVTIPEQAAFFADVLEMLEARRALPDGTLRFELMVEVPQAVLGADGRTPLPAFLDAARGRLTAAHFGTYDYTSGLGITAAHQRMRHRACDFARHVMQVAFAGTGIWLSDGSTAVLPVPIHESPATDAERAANREAVHRAWRMHFEDVRHSLVHGYYQGWDLHPAQLPTRFAAVFAFFLAGRDAAAARLRSLLAKAAQAGASFDDPHAGQALLNYFLRGIASGAFTEAEVCEISGLTDEELESRSFHHVLEVRQPR